MAQIGTRPVLDRDQERELGRRIMVGQQAQAVLGRPDGGPHGGRARRRLLDQRADGQAAAREMILHNLKLVVSVAKRCTRYDYPLLDAVQDGTLGLFVAVQRFDWRRPTKFATMARWWIWQAIQRGQVELMSPVRLPAHQWDRLRQVHRVADWLLLQNKETPDLPEISRWVGRPPAELQELLNLEGGGTSLNRPVRPDSTTELGELVPAAQLGTDDLAVSQVFISAALRTLKPVPASVINMRYIRGMSARDTAETLGLTAAELAAIDKRAKAQLRTALGDVAHLDR